MVDDLLDLRLFFVQFDSVRGKQMLFEGLLVGENTVGHKTRSF